MKNFESRFSAQVAKFNAISNTTKLPECLTALMLLSNSAIDDNQRVSVWAATAPADPTMSSQSTNVMFLSAITYQSVASIVKKCDRTHTTSVNQNSLAGSSAGTTQRYGHSSPQNRGRTRPTKAEYEALMMKHLCNLCGKFGNWKRSHSADGSLPAHVKSVEKSDRNRAYAPVCKKTSVSSNMAKLIGSSAATTVSKDLRPLVDDGAPYSAISLVELKWLGKKLDPALSLTINPIPMTLNGYSHWQYRTGEHASQSTVCGFYSPIGRWKTYRYHPPCTVRVFPVSDWSNCYAEGQHPAHREMRSFLRPMVSRTIYRSLAQLF